MNIRSVLFPYRQPSLKLELRFMKFLKTLLASLNLLNRCFFQNFVWLTVSSLCIAMLFTSTARAQEYETDRIFIRQQSKNHCLIQVQDQIRELRKIREMSDEHSKHLNRDVWNRNRTGLQMNQKQQQRLNQLLKGNPGPKYSSVRQLQQKRQRRFAGMKQNCRDLASD